MAINSNFTIISVEHCEDEKGQLFIGALLQDRVREFILSLSKQDFEKMKRDCVSAVSLAFDHLHIPAIDNQVIMNDPKDVN